MCEQANSTPSPRDEEIAAILARGEAGVATATSIVEAVEGHYFAAVAATSTQPTVVTTNSAW